MYYSRVIGRWPGSDPPNDPRTRRGPSEAGGCPKAPQRQARSGDGTLPPRRPTQTSLRQPCKSPHPRTPTAYRPPVAACAEHGHRQVVADVEELGRREEGVGEELRVRMGGWIGDGQIGARGSRGLGLNRPAACEGPSQWSFQAAKARLSFVRDRCWVSKRSTTEAVTGISAQPASPMHWL